MKSSMTVFMKTYFLLFNLSTSCLFGITFFPDTPTQIKEHFYSELVKIGLNEKCWLSEKVLAIKKAFNESIVLFRHKNQSFCSSSSHKIEFCTDDAIVQFIANILVKNSQISQKYSTGVRKIKYLSSKEAIFVFDEERFNQDLLIFASIVPKKNIEEFVSFGDGFDITRSGTGQAFKPI